MQLTIVPEDLEAYQNFVDSVRDKETLRKYRGYLKYFLELIPDSMYKNYLGYEPQSRDLPVLANCFTKIALDNVKNAKSIVKAYVKELKILHKRNELSAATLKNRIKPIKKICKANDVEISWSLLDESMPKPGKAKDRAYTLIELQDMMQAAVKLVDKVIVTMSAAGGFRVESWNYFTWQDLIFFRNDDGTFKGAALLVYRGDIEEYVTCITPEACNFLWLYREEWKKRFLHYPNPTDPILANEQRAKITRLRLNGVKQRVVTLAEAIGMRPQLKKGVKRHEVMITHGFRKSWSTNMRRAKVDFADKEEMMGHTIGQEQSYQRYVEEDFEMFPEYQKAIPLLTISDEQREKAKSILQQKKIEELEGDKKEIVIDQQKQIDDLKNKQEEFEKMWMEKSFPTIKG